MKKKITDTNTEMNQTLELPAKDFKAITIKALQQSVINSVETNEKIESSVKKYRLLKKNGND